MMRGFVLDRHPPSISPKKRVGALQNRNLELF